MARLSEKQLLWTTIAGSAVLIGGLGALIWWDLDRIYAAEITDEHPEAAEISEPEQWGELRQIQEIEKQLAAARVEADLIPKREQDVIVYREIVARDAAVLPNEDEVNRLAVTIGDFERMAGVTLTKVSDLNTSAARGQAIAHIPIKLQLSGSFDQVLKFMNLFETLDRIVNVTSFTINGGRAASGEDGGTPIHAVTLDLTTYMYRSTAGIAKPVDIPNYEQRKNSDDIQRLIRQKKAAIVEKYQLQPRVDRRDPLVDPRRSADDVPVDEDPKAAADQKDLVNKLKFNVELIRDDVQQERTYAAQSKLVPLAQLSKLIDEKVVQLAADLEAAKARVTIAELREVLQDDVVRPFEEIKSERQMTDRPVLMSAIQVREFLERMHEAMKAYEYRSAIETYESFQRLLGSTEVVPDAQPLVDEMVEIQKEAAVSLDFERMKLVYSGTILQPNGSVVFVNGKALRVGSYVDAEGRCRIVEISSDHVRYDFDGFEIQDPLNKK